MSLFIAETRLFSRWAQKEKIADEILVQAAVEIETGLLEARLGHGLVKKRLPAAGRGKRSGYRTIVGCRQGDLVIFLYGYAKNERETVSPRELEALAELSLQFMSASRMVLADMLATGRLVEVAG